MSGTLDVGQTFHFSSSVLISGMIASGLAYFPITLVSVKAFLPRLLRDYRDPLPMNLDGRLDAYLVLLCSGWLLGIPLFVLQRAGDFKFLLQSWCSSGRREASSRSCCRE